MCSSSFHQKSLLASPMNETYKTRPPRRLSLTSHRSRSPSDPSFPAHLYPFPQIAPDPPSSWPQMSLFSCLLPLTFISRPSSSRSQTNAASSNAGTGTGAGTFDQPGDLPHALAADRQFLARLAELAEDVSTPTESHSHRTSCNRYSRLSPFLLAPAALRNRIERRLPVCRQDS